MNMVVHDMRNPTVSTKLGLEVTLEKLSEAETVWRELQDFVSYQHLRCNNQPTLPKPYKRESFGS